MQAVGVIAKEGKKDIVWRGFPAGMTRATESSGLERAVAERRQRAEAVEKKQAQLKVWEVQQGGRVRSPNSCAIMHRAIFYDKSGFSDSQLI